MQMLTLYCGANPNQSYSFFINKVITCTVLFFSETVPVISSRSKEDDNNSQPSNTTNDDAQRCRMTIMTWKYHNYVRSLYTFYHYNRAAYNQSIRQQFTETAAQHPENIIYSSYSLKIIY